LWGGAAKRWSTKVTREIEPGSSGQRESCKVCEALTSTHHDQSRSNGENDSIMLQLGQWRSFSHSGNVVIPLRYRRFAKPKADTSWNTGQWLNASALPLQKQPRARYCAGKKDACRDFPLRKPAKKELARENFSSQTCQVQEAIVLGERRRRFFMQ